MLMRSPMPSAFIPFMIRTSSVYRRWWTTSCWTRRSSSINDRSSPPTSDADGNDRSTLISCVMTRCNCTANGESDIGSVGGGDGEGVAMGEGVRIPPGCCMARDTSLSSSNKASSESESDDCSRGGDRNDDGRWNRNPSPSSDSAEEDETEDEEVVAYMSSHRRSRRRDCRIVSSAVGVVEDEAREDTRSVLDRWRLFRLLRYAATGPAPAELCDTFCNEFCNEFRDEFCDEFCDEGGGGEEGCDLMMRWRRSASLARASIPDNDDCDAEGEGECYGDGGEWANDPNFVERKRQTFLMF